MNDIRKYIDAVEKLNEAELSKGAINSVFTNAEKIGKKGFSFKKKASWKELMNAWKNSNFSDDSRDIINILKKHGYSGYEIRKAFEISNIIEPSSLSKKIKQRFSGERFKSPEEQEVEISPTVKKLGDFIVSGGMKKDITSFLSDEYGFRALSESVDFLLEKKLSDRDIKQLFLQLTSISTDATPPSSDVMRNYVKKWASKFISSPMYQKHNLTAEIINFLADRKNMTEWEEMVGTVTKIIRDSGMEEEYKQGALLAIEAGKHATAYQQEEKPRIKVRAITSPADQEPDKDSSELNNATSIKREFIETKPLQILFSKIVQEHNLGRSKK